MDRTKAFHRKWWWMRIAACMFVVLALSSACLDAQGNKNRLRQEIARANEDFPSETPGVGRIDSVGLVDDDNVVAYYLTVHEGSAMLSLDVMKANADIVKRKMINSALAGNRKTLELFKRYQVGLRYIFSEENTEKKVIVDIPLEEIAHALEQELSKTEAANLALKDDLFMSKQALPMQVQEGLTIVDYILDDNQLVYVIDVDEDAFPISAGFDKNVAKEGVMEGLSAQPAGMTSTMDNLVKTARGLTYRYVGNKTKTQIDIEITTLELRSILANI